MTHDAPGGMSVRTTVLPSASVSAVEGRQASENALVSRSLNAGAATNPCMAQLDTTMDIRMQCSSRGSSAGPDCPDWACAAVRP